jgi:hypothetical protein
MGMEQLLDQNEKESDGKDKESDANLKSPNAVEYMAARGERFSEERFSRVEGHHNAEEEKPRRSESRKSEAGRQERNDNRNELRNLQDERKERKERQTVLKSSVQEKGKEETAKEGTPSGQETRKETRKESQSEWISLQEDLEPGEENENPGTDGADFSAGKFKEFLLTQDDGDMSNDLPVDDPPEESPKPKKKRSDP